MLIFTICNLIWIEDLKIFLVVLALALTLIVSGKDIYNNFWVLEEYQIMIFSLSGMITNVLFLWHYLVDASFDFLIKMLLENGVILPWLLLVILVNVIAYCIYDGKQIWHGANAALGYFILILQKNVISLFVAAMMLLLIPCVYRPTEKLVRRSMQMISAYIVILCGTAFLTTYTDAVIDAPKYDIWTSNCVGIVFVVFAAIFFDIWFKEKAAHNEDGLPMIKMREYFEKAALLVLIAFIMTFAYRAKGINHPLFINITESLNAHKGLPENAWQLYGVLGAICVGALFYFIISCLLKYRQLIETRSQKLSRMVTAVYLVQSLFFTQSVDITVAYWVFIVAYINSVRLSLRNVGDDSSDEADDSDTVLQRSEDIGDSAQ